MDSKNNIQIAPLFERMSSQGYEEVVFCHDRNSGLHAIIAVHDTRLGPSLGGCRFYHYPSMDEALHDVLNLARAMTYKAAIADLPLGGGKSVIIGNPEKDKSEALFKAFADFINRLGGSYITAEDSGTSQEDMDIIRKYTKHVTGAGHNEGGSGDPSPTTAQGVVEGIQACAKYVYGSDDLSGKVIAIQGVGHVGFSLATRLKKLGANLILTDRNRERLAQAAKETDAKVVEPEDIFSQKCHIFAPCALGGVINEKTLPVLQCEIIAGAANNQLAREEYSEALREKNITYAPDFAINAGGLTHVAREVYNWKHDEVDRRVKNIYKTVYEILDRAHQENVTTSSLANRLAEERLQRAR